MSNKTKITPIIYTVCVELTYRDKTYTSEYNEMTNGEIMDLTDTINEVISGNMYPFTINNKKDTFFFGENVLKESIITIYKSIKTT